ncbi:hypothetical protein IT418_00985 [bacterium]|nr:hypothetical protein [bacterium]
MDVSQGKVENVMNRRIHSGASPSELERTEVVITGEETRLPSYIKSALREQAHLAIVSNSEVQFGKNIRNIASAVYDNPDCFSELNEKVRRSPSLGELFRKTAQRIVDLLQEGSRLFVIPPYEYKGSKRTLHRSLRFRVVLEPVMETKDRYVGVALVKEWMQFSKTTPPAQQIKLLKGIAERGGDWGYFAILLGYFSFRVKEDQIKEALVGNDTKKEVFFNKIFMERKRIFDSTPILEKKLKLFQKQLVPTSILGRYIRENIRIIYGIDFGSKIRAEILKLDPGKTTDEDKEELMEDYGNIMLYKPFDVFHAEVERAGFAENLFVADDANSVFERIEQFIEIGYQRMINERDKEAQQRRNARVQRSMA